MSKYLIADMLSALANCRYNGSRPAVVILPYSNFCHSLAQVLIDNGYLLSSKVEDKGNNIKVLVVECRFENQKNLIRTFKVLSKPSRRVYASVKVLKKMVGFNAYNVLAVSTPQGVFTASEAIEKNIGGEVLCEIF